MPHLDQKRAVIVAALALSFLFGSLSYLYIPDSAPVYLSAEDSRITQLPESQASHFQLRLAPAELQQSERKKSFEHIYESHFWDSKESISGRGSDRSATERARRLIGHAIEKYNIRELVDAPAGELLR